jgi:hypothetical protein
MRILFPIMVMVFSLVISGCAPTAGNDPSSAPVAETTVEAPANEQISQDTAVPTISETVTAPIMIATSRGDKLVATDPASVNLVSSVPTLVEFFRFT